MIELASRTGSGSKYEMESQAWESTTAARSLACEYWSEVLAQHTFAYAPYVGAQVHMLPGTDNTLADDDFKFPSEIFSDKGVGSSVCVF